MGRWSSKVGDGKYRLSYQDGQLIGIEIWPEGEDGQYRDYFVANIKYERPRAWRRLLGLRRHRRVS